MCPKESHSPRSRTHLASQVPQLHAAGFKDQTILNTLNFRNLERKGEEEWRIEISPPTAQGHLLCPWGKADPWPEATRGETLVPDKLQPSPASRPPTWKLTGSICNPLCAICLTHWKLSCFSFLPRFPFIFSPLPQRPARHAGEMRRRRRKEEE